MNEQKLDLRELAIDRTSDVSTAGHNRRSRWLLRYGLPFSILLGFAVLFVAAAGRQFIPRHDVTVIPVIVKKAGIRSEGATLFHAAGWIEPRPTAVNVAALVPGVIEELLVVEGQRVSQGDPIARLVVVDAEIALQQAQAALAIREGELQGAVAERDAAVVRLENPVHLRVQLADAGSLLARATTELQKLPFLIRAAEANLKFTESSLQGKQAAESAIAGVVVRQAENEYATSRAKLEELQTRIPNQQREVEALQEKVKALQTQLELLVEENRQMLEATAKVQSATAIRDEAGLRVRLAKLNLDRTVVRAPVGGRILRLLASPGDRVMGMDENKGQNAGVVVEMYDPARLQVRADVRLEDVPMVVPGSPVEIHTASSDKTISGRVLRSTSSANIQKNTLEVKVELIDPPAAVSPEMLVTATFKAPDLSEATVKSDEAVSIYVPEQFVHSANGVSLVWIVDVDSAARRRNVTVGTRGQDGLIEITDGLSVTDKLIASSTDQLHPGMAVTISAEDDTIGIDR